MANLDDATLQGMITKAEAARNNSHAPWSQFRVGACLMAEDGSLYTGANVEIARCCAERCAIVSAVSNGHKKFKALTAISDMDAPITPCGMCRQSLYEFGIMHLYGAKSIKVDGKYSYEYHNLLDLMPYPVGPQNL